VNYMLYDTAICNERSRAEREIECKSARDK
jgi:hypothetical protein